MWRPDTDGTRRIDVASIQIVESIWLKQLLRKDPDLYFDEVRKKFVAKRRWGTSDAMISKALHFEGEGLSCHRRNEPTVFPGWS